MNECVKTPDPVITAAMLEAGFQVWRRSGITDDPLEADKLVLAEVYLAMLSAAAEDSLNARQSGCKADIESGTAS